METLPEGLRARLRPLLEQVESLTEKIKEMEANRAEGPTGISGNETAAASEWSRDVDLDDICVDGGRSRTIPEEPGRGLLCGTTTEAQRVGPEPASVANQQRRRYIFAEDAGARGALYSEPRGPDTDLKRWGLKLAAHGGKNAKKRAVVAVARKLAMLLHQLWVTGEVYEPLRNSQMPQEHQTAA